MIEVVEASYQLSQGTRPWLKGILDAARPHLDRGAGLLAGCYDARDVSRFSVSSLVGVGCGVPAWATGLRTAARRLSPDEVQRSFVSRSFGTVSEMLGDGFLDRNPFARALGLFGIRDGLGMNAIDPTGVGCVLGAWLPARQRTPDGLGEVLTYVGAHIAAGHRLRRAIDRAKAKAKATPRLRGPRASEAAASAAYLLESAEAILSPAGEVAHAADSAKGVAERLMLRAAAAAFDRSRTRQRQADPQATLLDWKALVAGRWSVVDCFDSDGRRFLVAHRNDPPPDTVAAADAGGPQASLSLRERQVVGYAALGHANKNIAYDLGISVSSVATHLVNATAKLGATSRADLIAKACWRRDLRAPPSAGALPSPK